MKRAAGTAAKSRRDSHSSSPFSLSPTVPFFFSSLAPTEMWIDGDPPGNSSISCPPPFAPLEEKKKKKQRRRERMREIQQVKEKLKCAFSKLAAG